MRRTSYSTILTPSPPRSRLKPSRARGSRSPSTTLSSASHQTLQLWVDHSLNISARCSLLLSNFSTNHAAAQSDHAATAHVRKEKRQTALLPTSRLQVRTDFERRKQLRERRRAFVKRIQQREQDEKERVEEARLQNIRMQQEAKRKEKEIRQQKERALLLEKQQKEQREKEKEKKNQQRQVAVSNGADAKPAPVLSSLPSASANAGKSNADNSSTGGMSLSSSPMLSTQPDPKATGATATASKKKEEAEDEDYMPFVAQAKKTWATVCDEAKQFRANTSMSQVRRHVLKGVNLAVNQVAASVKQVSLKVNDLCKLIAECEKVGGANGQSFAMKTIAERLIRESDFSVALSESTAYAVAAVIVGVTAHVGNVDRMRDCFLGAFFDHCVYTMPKYIRKKADESVDEYKKRMGYKTDETTEGYMERMCGCVNLFAAVLQTEHVYPQKHFGPKASNPFSLGLAWSWLARIVNREQRAMSSSIVFAFLELGGYTMSVRYGKQFAKLMAMIQKAVVLKAPRSAPKGPTSRLDVLISEYVEAGCKLKAPESRALPQSDAEFL